MWKDFEIYKLKDKTLAAMTEIQNSTAGSSTLEPQDKSEKPGGDTGAQKTSQGGTDFRFNLTAQICENEGNWERVYIKADKYSGTLRYTMDRNAAREGKYRHKFDNVDYLEIMNE